MDIDPQSQPELIILLSVWTEATFFIIPNEPQMCHQSDREAQVLQYVVRIWFIPKKKKERGIELGS